jgi:Tfp pilus assembly protein PilN
MLNIFFPKVVGLSLKENNLVVTKVHRRLLNASCDSIEVKDFLLKDPQQVKPTFGFKKDYLVDIVLSWPREKTIIREINSPATGIKELRAALEYQLDSFFPFTNEEVYFDIYPVTVPGQGKKIFIVAVKKEELDDVLSRLTALEMMPSRVIFSPLAFIPLVSEKSGKVAIIYNGAGTSCYNLFLDTKLVSSSLFKTREDLFDRLNFDSPDEIIIPGQGEDAESEVKLPEGLKDNVEVSFLDETRESLGAALYYTSTLPYDFSLIKAKKRRTDPQMTLLWFLTGLLIVSALFIPYIISAKKHEGIELINTRIATLRGKASGVEGIIARCTKIENIIDKISVMKDAYVPRLDMLLELTNVLPNNAWIRNLTISGNNFEIEGTATSASFDLIRLLENSPLFENVGLTSPVIKGHDGKERFRIKGNVEIHK